MRSPRPPQRAARRLARPRSRRLAGRAAAARRRGAPAHPLHLDAGRRGRAGVAPQRVCRSRSRRTPRTSTSRQPADLRRKLSAARFTVTCTDFNCRTLRALAAPGSQVHRMYHGIDAGVFHPSRRAAAARWLPLLLSVGRLREKKGLDTLIEACRLLRDRGVRVPLRDRRLWRGARAAGRADRLARAAATRSSSAASSPATRSSSATPAPRSTCSPRAWPPTATATASPTCCSKPWRWACRWSPPASPASPKSCATATTACWSGRTTRPRWPTPSRSCFEAPALCAELGRAARGHGHPRVRQRPQPAAGAAAAREPVMPTNRSCAVA